MSDLQKGTYCIQNLKTGTVLDLDNSQSGEGITIFGFQSHGGNNQKWSVQPGSNGSLTLRSVQSNMYVGHPRFSKGPSLQSVSEPAEYLITEADEGYNIAPVDLPSHVLELASNQNRSQVRLWPNSNQDHQKWKFVAV